MNWIKDNDTDKSTRNCFINELVPISNELHEEGKTFFSRGPDPEALTYYKKRENIAMKPEDFEVPGCVSLSSLEKALAELWNSQGHSEIIHLAQTTSKLANLLYSYEEVNEEVSPFIYVMF